MTCVFEISTRGCIILPMWFVARNFGRESAWSFENPPLSGVRDIAGSRYPAISLMVFSC